MLNIFDVIKKKKETETEGNTLRNIDKADMILSDSVFISKETDKNNPSDFEKSSNVIVINDGDKKDGQSFIISNILQMNRSFILEDINGEIYEKTSVFLKDNGYDVWVFDLRNGKFGGNNSINLLSQIDSPTDIKTACMLADVFETSHGIYQDTASKRIIAFVFLYCKLRNISLKDGMGEIFKTDKVLADCTLDDVVDSLNHAIEYFCSHVKDIAIDRYLHSDPELKTGIAAAQSKLGSLFFSESYPFITGPVRRGINDKKTAVFCIKHGKDRYGLGYQMEDMLSALLYATLLNTATVKTINGIRKPVGIPIRFYVHVIERENSYFLISGLQRHYFSNIAEYVVFQKECRSYEDICLGEFFKILLLETHNIKTADFLYRYYDGNCYRRPPITTQDMTTLPSDKCIIFQNTEKPIVSKKFDLTTHPKYKEMYSHFIVDFNNR